MSSTISKGQATYGSTQSQSPDAKEVVTAETFRRMIALERKRSERTQRPFVLLLMETTRTSSTESGRVLLDILAALQTATRETDVKGWYDMNSSVGVIFTEIALENNLIFSTILTRLRDVVRARLSADQFSQIKFSFHLFPQEWDSSNQERQSNPILYPDLQKRDGLNRISRTWKRALDVVGSICFLGLLAPLFCVIAIAVKVTSKGPVLFRQKRIGEHGTPFTFLKFRSMYVNNDASEHKEYVSQLIAGQASKQQTNGMSEGIFKLTNDRRITSIGTFLRRTSLDELPQLFNVLRGDMSLVGPRPPIPYEVEAYETWHRCRLFEAKPGITGLWQVQGRSRVGFDEMVRLDLRYARTCSPWLDMKILLQTPKAVIAGDGAC